MALGTGKTPQRKLRLVDCVTGLTETQIQALVCSLDDRWTIDRHECVDGGAALMITPSNIRGMEKVYYIDSDRGHLNLSIMEGDEFRGLGRFGEVDALLSTINPQH